MRLVLIGTIVFQMAAPASANLSAVGNCSSVGQWTLSALQASDELQTVLRRIQKDPNCGGLQSAVLNLQRLKNTMGLKQGSNESAARLESIPSEIRTLREVIRMDQNSRDDLLKALANRTTEEGQIIGKDGHEPILINGNVESLKNRATKVTQHGLGILESVFNELPRYDQCLEAHPSEALILIQSAVALSASFASNTEATSNSLATALGSMVEMFRSRRMTKVLRGLATTQMRASLSCMLETLSQNYCSAYDARTLLEKNWQSINSQTGKIDLNSPFAGHYILTRPVPVVTSWIQEILMGITPQLSTDAGFKNEVWATVGDTIQVVNRIWGMYYQNKFYMTQLGGGAPEDVVVAKRVHIFALIKSLSTYLADNGGGKHNFFTKTVTAKTLPWFLIGRNSPPKSVQGNENTTGFVQNTFEAMELDGRTFTPEFNDPEALHDVIKNRLQILANRALEMAQAYLRQYIVVDVGDLVGRAVSDPNYPVTASLQTIRSYLLNLEQQTRKAMADKVEGIDEAMVPYLVETRLRIEELLTTFEQARSLRTTLPNFKLPALKDAGKELGTSPEFLDDKAINQFREKITQSYTVVIDTLFSNFNLLLQRDSFLLNRLNTAVRLDYSLKTRNGLNLNAYEADLFQATDTKLNSMMMDLHGKNSTAVKLDLEKAMDMNIRNLSSFEKVFSDFFERTILVKGMQARNERPTPLAINIALAKRLGETAKNEKSRVFGQNKIVSVGLSAVFGPIVESYYTYKNWLGRPDLFHKEPFNLRAPALPQDEGGSIGQLRAQLCVQTLAFQDWKRFADICKDSVLFGTYVPKGQEGRHVKFDLQYNDFLSGTTETKAYYNNDQMSARVCALRDYSRKHIAYWLNQISGGQQ